MTLFERQNAMAAKGTIKGKAGHFPVPKWRGRTVGVSPPARRSYRLCWYGIRQHRSIWRPASRLLPRQPLAYVWRAIHQPDAGRFAPGEKINSVLPCQNQILHVKNDGPDACFPPNQRFQLGYAFFVQSPAKGNDHFPVRFPVNSKQDQSPYTDLVREGQSKPIARRITLKIRYLYVSSSYGSP